MYSAAGIALERATVELHSVAAESKPAVAELN